MPGRCLEKNTVTGQARLNWGYMEYREIDGVNKKVSRLLFGTTSLTEYDERAEELLDGILANGVNSFDSARVYSDGRAEDVLGRWMEAKKNREDVVVLTKGAHPDMATWKSRLGRQDILDDINVSLDKLRTDYIDIYLLHRDDLSLPVGPIVETLNELKDAGKVKVFGGSNWTVERICEANQYAKEHGLAGFTVSSPHFGIAEQEHDLWYGGVTLTGDANKPAREWYETNQMPVVAYSGLGCGIFSGKVKSSEPEKAWEYFWEGVCKAYAGERNIKRLARCEELAKKKGASISQVAIAWMLNQKLNAFPVVSSSNLNRMKSNIDALEIDLSQDECKYLNLE